MKLSRFLPAVALLLAAPAFAAAQEKLPAGANVTRIDVWPAKVELTRPFAYAQLLVTATLDNGETADVTRIATYELPAGFTQKAGLVRAASDGSGSYSRTRLESSPISRLTSRCIL